MGAHKLKPVRDWELRSVPSRDDVYWVYVRKVASMLDSDGCSGVPDFYLESCLEHDIHYRTHHTLDGRSISRRQADMRIRRVVQSRSRFGVLSPLSWWRWAGLRILGGKAWRK